MTSTVLLVATSAVVAGTYQSSSRKIVTVMLTTLVALSGLAILGLDVSHYDGRGKWIAYVVGIVAAIALTVTESLRQNPAAP